MASKIIGCGGYLPSKIVTNADLAKVIDTSDEWIRSRTGIAQRHVASEGEYSSHMGFEAANLAIKDANIDPKDIDLIITCTTTPDNSFPSTANKIQGYLKLGEIPSFDLQAVCSGFVYGLQVADSMIKSGKYKTVLLICTEKMSSLLDWQDRSTCVLFGDGAGAVILQHNNSNSGIIDTSLYSDGSMYEILYTDGGVGINGKSGIIKMNGSEVFKRAVEKMLESIKYILSTNNLAIKDIDYLIAHQANKRIIDYIANKLNIPENKSVISLEKHANCSAASIPLALSKLKSTKGIEDGKLIIFTAFGAGASWGAALVRW
jgi:3-oxoacyl-[acyl-carrier-protein] synthase III